MNKLKGERGVSIKCSSWDGFNGDGHSDKDFLLNTDSCSAHQRVQFPLQWSFRVDSLLIHKFKQFYLFVPPE